MPHAFSTGSLELYHEFYMLLTVFKTSISKNKIKRATFDIKKMYFMGQTDDVGFTHQNVKQC